MDCRQAVRLAKEGKDEGFRYLYESTYKTKYYLAVKYMKNEDAAEDVLQDAYIRAFSSLDSLENPEAFPAWLGMIVANTAKNALKKRNPLLFSDVSQEGDDEPFEYEVADESTESQPENAYSRKETQELVRELIDSLSEEQRVCILMFEIEGIPIKEIAATLQCSENTVKSRLNYGRKNIKKKAEDLQKKGYKLYSLAPLPLLLWLLRAERAQSEEFLAAAQAHAEGRILEAAGNIASGSATGTAVTGAVKAGFLHTAAGKITTGLLTLAIVGGTAVGIYGARKAPEPTKVTEPFETTLPQPTETEPTKTEPQETELADADFPELMVGGLTRREVEYALSYAPVEMSLADGSYNGSTIESYLQHTLPVIYDKEGNAAYQPGAVLPEPDSVIACYGLNSNGYPIFSLTDLNRVLALFSDYQINEATPLPYSYVQGDRIYCKLIVTSGIHTRAEILSAKMTDGEIRLLYNYKKDHADPSAEDMTAQLLAVLHPTADGKYRVTEICNADEAPEVQTPNADFDPIPLFEAYLNNLRDLNAVDIFTAYVAKWKDIWPEYVTYLEEHSNLQYLYQDLDGDEIPELLVMSEGITDRGTQVIPVSKAYACRVTDGETQIIEIAGTMFPTAKPIDGYGVISYQFSRGTGLTEYHRITVKDGALHYEAIPEYTFTMGDSHAGAVNDRIKRETTCLEWTPLSPENAE